jgi:TetR/AcrR family transcriptional regulator, repressor for neighboring sulfatase
VASLHPRPRRTAETARANILDAADRIFAKSLPDAVGLREIATEANVSHALITHYFMTYEGLIEATMARQFASLGARSEIRLANQPDMIPLVATLMEVLENATLQRLISWAYLTGRGELVTRYGNGRFLVDAVAERLGQEGEVCRDKVDVACVLASCVVVGMGILRDRATSNLGIESPMSTTQLRAHLERMIQLLVLERALPVQSDNVRT